MNSVMLENKNKRRVAQRRRRAARAERGVRGPRPVELDILRSTLKKLSGGAIEVDMREASAIRTSGRWLTVSNFIERARRRWGIG